MVAAATPVPALTLIGFGNWDLVTFNGHALIEGTSINLTFTDKFLTGKMSCNSYGGGRDSGAYLATEDGRLTVGTLAMTLRDCPEPAGIWDQEKAYVDAVSDAATYQILDDRLEISDSTGKVFLVFEKKLRLSS